MKRSPMKSKALPRTALEKRKFAWLHSFNRCCLSGRPEIHVAHLHEGQHAGMARKVGPELTLPLHWALHAEQHRTREFWPSAFKGDPVDWALRLHDLFERDAPREEVDDLLWDMHDRANIPYLVSILTRAA